MTMKLPNSENELRDLLLEVLRPHFPSDKYSMEPERTVPYNLPDGTVLTHASDILIADRKSDKRVSLELKYQSAVTDQFKCRAYDAMHMKQHHGDSLLAVLLFAKAQTGISIKRAQAICHPFDLFYGAKVEELLAEGGLLHLVEGVKEFFNN